MWTCAPEKAGDGRFAVLLAAAVARAERDPGKEDARQAATADDGERVLRLAQAGMSLGAIARALGRPRGEVELLLRLARARLSLR